MTEREKMVQGLPYNAGDPELMQARRRCKELCFAFNQTPPSQRDKQQALLRSLLVQADAKNPHRAKSLVRLRLQHPRGTRTLHQPQLRHPGLRTGHPLGRTC